MHPTHYSYLEGVEDGAGKHSAVHQVVLQLVDGVQGQLRSVGRCLDWFAPGRASGRGELTPRTAAPLDSASSCSARARLLRLHALYKIHEKKPEISANGGVMEVEK